MCIDPWGRSTDMIVEIWWCRVTPKMGHVLPEDVVTESHPRWDMYRLRMLWLSHTQDGTCIAWGCRDWVTLLCLLWLHMMVRLALGAWPYEMEMSTHMTPLSKVIVTDFMTSFMSVRSLWDHAYCVPTLTSLSAFWEYRCGVIIVYCELVQRIGWPDDIWYRLQFWYPSLVCRELSVFYFSADIDLSW